MSLEDPVNYAERLCRHRGRRLIGGRVSALLTVLGLEIPQAVTIGRGCHLAHGAFGLVLHESTVIGNDVTLFQGVTVGRADQANRVPVDKSGGVVIGDRVIIGANACVLFRSGETLTIGDDAVVGAGAIVLSSVPSGETWAGMPARKVGQRD